MNPKELTSLGYKPGRVAIYPDTYTNMWYRKVDGTTIRIYRYEPSTLLPHCTTPELFEVQAQFDADVSTTNVDLFSFTRDELLEKLPRIEQAIIAMRDATKGDDK